MQYEQQRAEAKWANKWVRDGVFVTDLDGAKNPYYALFMFPYPSAEGLHIGNFYAFTSVDAVAKYHRLRGMDVFEPFGFDAFGMHSENYALKINENPQTMLKRTMSNFRKQMMDAGMGVDFTREVDTTSPRYYKWTQWIFTQMLKKGLAFQKEAFLNWCPSCKTVLADEQIEGGVCERCKEKPEKKNMKQWFLKITAYADRLLDGLDDMDWSESTKQAQRNWIGRSEGTEVLFDINGEKVPVFTTRADTLFGCTYFVLSPEHPLVSRITTDNKRDEVEGYVKEAGARSDLERTEEKEKTGVFTGAYATNPVNDKKVPVWIADYVLINYGTGAVMAVPAHDERDFDFAKKYKLPITVVVSSSRELPFMGEGSLINSDSYNGVNSREGREKITRWLIENKLGEKKTNYRLRDWCISRQRYWGPPIPVVYCRACGTVPVGVDSLPVLLPENMEQWQPSGEGKGPLSQVPDFVKTNCPKCGLEGERETDVMDNFLDSAWYFFRYLSPENEKDVFDRKLGEKWLPVDIYIGGNEHAVLHLMYTRFITMFFNDIGVVDFDNPFKKFRANGMVLKDGKKMSKSKGNVVNPEEIGRKVGYDVLKTYLLFLGPLCDDKSFSDEGIFGVKRWLDKVSRLEEKVKKDYTDKKEVLQKLNRGVKKIEQDFEEHKYNTTVAQLMEITNTLTKESVVSEKVWRSLLAVVAPFTPALAEEMWERLGEKASIFCGKNWPVVDNEMVQQDVVDVVVQVNGKVRAVISVDVSTSIEERESTALASEDVKKWIEKKKIKKMITVKGKLINIVV